MLRLQKSPSQRSFWKVYRWLRAELLRFLFGGLGFRGKARFVLVSCCRCEGRDPTKSTAFGGTFNQAISNS
jgi:hypothetical protein